MKTMKWTTGLVVAALLTACGYDGLRGAYEGEQRDEAEPGQAPVATYEGSLRSVDVRLKARNAQAFRSLLMRPDAIEVRAGDRLLSSEVRGELTELTTENHAWRIGRFDLPEDVTEVELLVTMDAVAAFEKDDAAGSIDTRGAILSVTLPVERLDSGKVVLDIDAVDSFVELHDSELAFVPVWRTLH